MPEPKIPANRVMSGTWGQVWVDGVLWAELSGFQAKFAYNKSAVNICGRMAEDSK
ncbi:MAG: phage tail tube protein, partial [Oscillospiraceae bacterium]|nr:phage tail tube protein [Oscillospiraceae bacterium]